MISSNISLNFRKFQNFSGKFQNLNWFTNFHFKTVDQEEKNNYLNSATKTGLKT